MQRSCGAKAGTGDGPAARMAGGIATQAAGCTSGAASDGLQVTCGQGVQCGLAQADAVA